MTAARATTLRTRVGRKGKFKPKLKQSFGRPPFKQKKLGPAQRELIHTKIKNLVDCHTSERAACNTVADQLSLTSPTVRGIWQRMRANHGRAHGLNLFTVAEEEVLVATVEAFALAQHPNTRASLKAFARRLRPDLADRPLRGWVDDFLDRWKTRLTNVPTKDIKEGRVTPQTEFDTKCWVEEFPAYMKSYKLSWSNIVNADETRLIFDVHGRPHNSFIYSKASSIKGGTSTAQEHSAAYIPFVSASGQWIMEVFIFPFNIGEATDFVKEKRASRDDNSCPTYFMFNQSGYVNGDMWNVILGKFKERMSQVAPGLEPVLLLDNASPHKTLETLEWAVKNKIHLVFLPANTTHFLQPLDQKFFAALKKLVATAIRQKVSKFRSIKDELDQAILEIATAARQQLTQMTIKSSFATAGVWPWNPSTILERAANNVGKPKKSESAAEAPLDRARSLIKEDIAPLRKTVSFKKKQLKLRGVDETAIFFGDQLAVIKRNQQMATERKVEEVRARKEQQATKRQARDAEKARRVAATAWKSCKGKKHPAGQVPRCKKKSV